MVDAVVRGQPVAELLEHRAPRCARDQPEARDDQPLVEDLHLEDLLLERVGLERHVRELVEVWIVLGGAADLADQLQPRLGMARLVLHHRRVVELRLGIGRDVQQLGGHLAGELVGLQLLREHRAPHVLPTRLALRAPLPFRDRRDLAPGEVAYLPFLLFGELVEAQNACVGAPILLCCLDDLLGGHRRHIIVPFVELRKWPRKNDPDSIAARQAALDGRIDTEVFEQDLTPWVEAQEALTGVSVIPTAVIGPLTISLGDYELTEPDGALVERGRQTDEVYVPLAHTEGSLSDSLYRGARAAAESGGFRTEVLRDRMTRASAFVCRSAEDAAALARWVEAELPKMREWLAARDEDWISRYAKLREVETYVAGPLCHVLWAFTTGDACGPNMMTRNAYALNMGYVMEHAPLKPERAILEANMGGDKKPSHRYFERGGHGKTVIAEVTLTDEAVRRVLRTTIDDLLELSWAGTHGAVASGMQSVAFTPATAIAAVFAATGQDLGMVGTSSMAHGTGKRVEGGLNAAIRLPGLEVGTVGGGTTLPYARAWLGLMDCAGPGKVYRFAQIVAAATLALEISASSAMATSGSENFFKAHFERGGLR